jgi:hypothetical protein
VKWQIGVRAVALLISSAIQVPVEPGSVIDLKVVVTTSLSARRISGYRACTPRGSETGTDAPSSVWKNCYTRTPCSNSGLCMEVMVESAYVM